MVALVGDRPVYGRQVRRPEPSAPPAPSPTRAPGVRERAAGAPSTATASGASMRGELSMRGDHFRHLAQSAAPSSRRGPRLGHVDQGWTPQGQGYDKKRGEVLTTYYKKGHVLLSIQDKRSGDETHQVRLGGLPRDARGRPVEGPSHGGGVSTDGEHVYVADTHRIYVYNRAAIERAERRGTPAEPSQVMPVPNPPHLRDPATGIGLQSAGSYMAVRDGYAYVGAYSKDGDGKAGAVWRYNIDKQTGALIEGSRKGPIRAPDRAQGVAVVDGALLFTTGDQKLIHQPMVSTAHAFRANIDRRTDISNGQIDPYAQGLNIIGHELWVTYESGSHKYRDNVDHPRERIQRIPLPQLDLAAAHRTPAQLED